MFVKGNGEKTNGLKTNRNLLDLCSDFTRNHRGVEVMVSAEESFADALFLFLVNADVVDIHVNGEFDRGHVAAALAASVQLERNGILGVSFGSSMAGGYVNGVGCITGRINELAFVPVDYSASAPCDEWSGDRGCGVNYFSQQGAARLAAIHSIRRSCSPASG